MITFMTIVGARPQFIKASVVSRCLRSRPGMKEILVHTGQHYDQEMSEIFFRELDIPEPDVNLGVKSDRQGAQTARMLDGLERVMIECKPTWVIVYGDTNSTLAGSLAASKLQIPVAHVEAGLRSFNRAMPEEVNRVVADHLSDLLFVPTTAAMDNLRREGVPFDRICLVGDVMYDAALFYAKQADAQSAILSRLGLRPGGYLLSTIHRAENTDDPKRLASIFGGLVALAHDLPIVVALHPRTRKALAALPINKEVMETLRVIEPAGYLDMTMMEKHARLIVTDSGGIQKEAFFQGVPCVTLRDETEWVELVQSGWNVVVPPVNEQGVYSAVVAVLKKERPKERENFYGDGRSAEAIVKMLMEVNLARSVV